MPPRLLCLTWILMLLLAEASVVQAQTASVRGFVTDAADGQPLLGVNVALEDDAGGLRGAVTDGDGFFLLPGVPPGRHRLRASYIGYRTATDTLTLAPGATVTLRLALTPGEAALDEVLVEAERGGGAAAVTAGLQTIDPRDIALIPAPDVSGDLATYLVTLPGVVAVGDRGGQLFIRGGEPAHNLALLDGMVVYQPFHVLGFYSAFPADVLRSADVYAGGFGSRFSGRLSSVLDVHTRTGNKKAFRRSFSLAPFVSAGVLEGPLLRDRISFLASARESTIDRLASAYLDAPLPYRFGDLFGKVHAVITPNHQVSLSALHTHDRGAVDPEAADEIRWTNTAYGIRYLMAPQSLPILAEILVSASRLDTELGPRDAPVRTSEVGTVNVEVNVTNFAGRSRVDWGFFLRGPSLEAELGGLFQNLDARRARSSNVGAYAEPDLYVGRGLRVRPGVVVQLYGTRGVFAEPRLRLVWERGLHQVSAAAGLYRQELAGLTDRRDATNVFTAWAVAPLGRISSAAHLLVGYRVTPRPWLGLSAEGFYKRLDDLFISEWTAFPRFTTTVQEASGRAAGVDLRLEVRRPRVYGFVTYGLASVRYEAMQEALAIWFGTATLDFRPPHDRRHQVNALVSTTFRKIDLSARWQYGSGLPYNQVRAFDGFVLMDGPVDVRAEPGTPRVIYDRPFGGTLPAYHRLDLSAARTFTYGDDSYITLQAGLINTYDRANLFALDLFTLRRTDQLPVIPTAGIKFEF